MKSSIIRYNNLQENKNDTSKDDNPYNDSSSSCSYYFTSLSLTKPNSISIPNHYSTTINPTSQYLNHTTTTIHTKTNQYFFFNQNNKSRNKTKNKKNQIKNFKKKSILSSLYH